MFIGLHPCLRVLVLTFFPRVDIGDPKIAVPLIKKMLLSRKRLKDSGEDALHGLEREFRR